MANNQLLQTRAIQLKIVLIAKILVSNSIRDTKYVKLKFGEIYNENRTSMISPFDGEVSGSNSGLKCRTQPQDIQIKKCLL